MDFRYTRHQVARGTRSDHETDDKYYLIKIVSEMRATYQVRLLTYFAHQKKKQLIIEVPKHCKIHSSLREFQKRFSNLIKIKRIKKG
jgi:hypothetical protein